MAGSVSGTSPGIALLGGITLPLNPDGYFSFTLQSPNTPPLGASLGFLSPSGLGTTTFALPPAALPQLAGLHLDHAYGALDPAIGTLLHASPAAGLELVP